MGAEHVIALIAAVLQVRNAIALNALQTQEQHDALLASLPDPIVEARALINAVVNDQPQIPEAPRADA